MKLMTALLSAHGEWFRLQRCKDRFSGPLRVDALKEADPESDVEGAAPDPLLIRRLASCLQAAPVVSNGRDTDLLNTARSAA